MIDVEAFDKNRDGYIDEHELRQTMHELGMKLSAEDVNAMMSQAGCRITGRVYYEGFTHWRIVCCLLTLCKIIHTFVHNVEVARTFNEQTVV